MPDTVENTKMNVSWPLLFKELSEQWKAQNIHTSLPCSAIRTKVAVCSKSCGDTSEKATDILWGTRWNSLGQLGVHGGSCSRKERRF